MKKQNKGLGNSPYIDGGFTYLNQDQLNNISDDEQMRIAIENSMESAAFDISPLGSERPKNVAFVGPIRQNNDDSHRVREREARESRERESRESREREARESREREAR